MSHVVRRDAVEWNLQWRARMIFLSRKRHFNIFVTFWWHTSFCVTAALVIYLFFISAERPWKRTRWWTLSFRPISSSQRPTCYSLLTTKRPPGQPPPHFKFMKDVPLTLTSWWPRWTEIIIFRPPPPPPPPAPVRISLADDVGGVWHLFWSGKAGEGGGWRWR